MPTATISNKVKMLVRGVPGPPGDQTSPFDYVLLNPLGGAVPDQEGAFVWNPTDQTLDINNGNITLQTGQEVVIKAVNKTGVLVGDGKAVSILGASGNRPQMVLADSTTALADSFIGLTTQATLNNQEGFLTVIGKVRGLNTLAYSEGDVVWVDPAIAGGLTNVEPTTGRVLKVGICLVSHLTIGEILVTTDVSHFTAEQTAALLALIA